MKKTDNYRECSAGDSEGYAVKFHNEDSVILFPDFAKLKSEVEKLRTEISMLLLEHDELLYTECKNIEMIYMLELGHLEYKVYELNCAVLRLKRKIELIQAKKNRQEKLIISDVEKKLDEEFAEYQVQLDNQINKMNDALKRSKGKTLTDDENRELKKLYRAVVKELHPDLHPDVSNAQLTFFRNAVEAYKNGDLASLRLISETVTAPALPKSKEDSMSALTKEKERLTETLQTIRRRITEIKNEYPYTLKPIIQSEEKIAEKKAELESVSAQLNEAFNFYKNKIEEMLR